MKKSGPFRFKQFVARHDSSSMKVGVDAVLVGALAPVEGARRVLDAGCGCGVIALMIAQRAPEARILAVDIDEASVEEAAGNFRESHWGDRLTAERMDFSSLPGESEEMKFDLIVSNPPFFRSGISNPESARLTARHQGSLSPFTLTEGARYLLRRQGRLCFICPSEFEEELLQTCREESLRVLQLIRIRGHREAPVKRMVLVVTPCADTESGDSEELQRRELILEESPGTPTEDYRSLCKDFYLRF